MQIKKQINKYLLIYNIVLLLLLNARKRKNQSNRETSNPNPTQLYVQLNMKDRRLAQ